LCTHAVQAEERLAIDAYDIEAWQVLLSDALQSGTVDDMREMFERFLTLFPTSVSASS